MSATPFVAGRSAPQAHSSLQKSLAALESARQSAVLWFAEIMERRLFEELGYSSINQYAREGLGFSKTRAGDFIRLARQLDRLPAVKQAVTSGELGYTKAREIVGVATPATQESWLEAAKKPRKELVREVKRVKRAARIDPAQTQLLPDAPTVVAPQELPVRFQVDLTPEQEARRAALVEKLHKLGGAHGNKAELLLDALDALVAAHEKTPRGVPTSRPPVQIIVHEREERMTVQTHAGERALSQADAARIQCDADICTPRGRNRAVIPPRVRREVLARDRHRCRAPGCGRSRFLEVHHRIPRSRGGTNATDNLMTLCAGCHRLVHRGP